MHMKDEKYAHASKETLIMEKEKLIKRLFTI